MKRLAIVADTHANTRSRFDEHERVMTFITQDVRDREVDLLVHAGDAFESDMTDAIERAAVGQWVQATAEHVPMAIVAGNHDNPRDIRWLGRLKTANRVVAFDTPGEAYLGGFFVGGLPWPRRAALLAALGAVPREQANGVAQECLRTVLRGFAADSSGSPRIFLGHVDIDGSVTDHDQPMVGGDMSVTLADLALADANFYACGHIHKAQTFNVNGAPCVYPGAPRHNNFGEATAGKGYTIADFEQDGTGLWRCVEVEHVPTPCRPMYLLEDEWGWDEHESRFDWLVGIHGGPSKTEDFRGSEVRFRYHVNADQRDAARAALAKYLEDFTSWGVVDIKVEERVRAVSKARAPEIARAATLEDKLDAFFTVRGLDIPADRRARLATKVAQIQAAPTQEGSP
jgi:predicted phosphodiesterase